MLFVRLHNFSTDVTHHLIDDKKVSLIKSGVMLVNGTPPSCSVHMSEVSFDGAVQSVTWLKQDLTARNHILHSSALKNMVPLKDENPIKITPYVTYILIAINVLVFVYELNLNSTQLDIFFHLFAVVPKELTASFSGVNLHQSIPETVTPISSQFLHAGFTHIAFNMLFLWIFGNNIEEQLGRVKFLLFYLSCGAFAVMAQWFFSAMSDVPSLGASGAIAGVMGAYILKFPQARIVTLVPLGFFFPIFRIPAVYFLGFWFVEQALNGVASFEVTASVGMESGGVAYWAHAGGFVAGAILGPMLGLFAQQSEKMVN